MSIIFRHIALLHATDSSMIQGVVTDEGGRFVLTEVRSGSYLLRASYVGYLHHYLPIYCKAGETSLHLDSIRMIPASATLGEVAIV